MNKVEDAVIKYAIDFERYKNGQANEIIKLLDKANKDIAKFIKETDGVYTKARYKEIAKKLKDVSATLKENVDEHTDLEGLIDYELRKEKKLLELAKPYIKKVKGGEINFLYPSREQIKTSALFKPITNDGYGMTYHSYLEGIEIGLFNTWDSAVRTGYLTGQTAKEITRNVLGSASKIGELTKQGTINSFRNNVYSNTRTVLQSFANETMQRVYEENEKYFGDGEYKYEYLSTLDSRTCLVCAESSSKLYKTLKECPHVPQHRGCRCEIIPYFNIEGDTKASKTGQIDSNLTFENWLKEQDDSTQQDVLGKFKFEQFQKGVPMKQFVDNGRVLTVDELKDRLDLKAYYGNKAEDFITQRYSNIENELTKNELYSLQKYTTYEYKAINACSRRGVDNGYENVVKDIANAVDKNEIGHSVTVYRGDGTDCIKGILSKSIIKDFDTLLEKDPEAFVLKLKGKKFFDYGFTSTSLDKQKAEIFTYNVFLQIDTKANTKGIYLESITSHKGEKELLLGACQYMRVKNVKVEELNGNKILKLFVDVI